MVNPHTHKIWPPTMRLIDIKNYQKLDDLSRSSMISFIVKKNFYLHRSVLSSRLQNYSNNIFFTYKPLLTIFPGPGLSLMVLHSPELTTENSLEFRKFFTNPPGACRDF